MRLFTYICRWISNSRCQVDATDEHFCIRREGHPDKHRYFTRTKKANNE